MYGQDINNVLNVSVASNVTYVISNQSQVIIQSDLNDITKFGIFSTTTRIFPKNSVPSTQFKENFVTTLM